LISFVLHQYIGAATFGKSMKFLNFQNVSVFRLLVAAGTVPPIYWCYHVSCTMSVGETLAVAPLVLVRTYGQNQHYF
jgi:hypothetical protein